MGGTILLLQQAGMSCVSVYVALNCPFLVALPKKKGKISWKSNHENDFGRKKYSAATRNISESGEKSTCFACEKACRELVCKSYNYGYANDKLCCCQHFKKTLKISRGPWAKGMGRVVFFFLKI